MNWSISLNVITSYSIHYTKLYEDQFAEYEALVNNPFNLRVSKLGAIIDIYKADKILNKFLDIKNLSDSVDAQQKIP